MQFCPAAQNAPDTQLSAAQRTSASLHTITGELEPSSIPIFLIPASFVIRCPASRPPVNEIIRTRGSATSASPISAPWPVSVCSTSGGSPASTNASVSLSADSGVTVAGLRIDRVAGRDRRAELVRHQVQWVVERRDREHDPDRHPLVVPHALLAAGERVERDRLARDALGLLGGDRQRVDAAPRLLARLADRLGALPGDRGGELLEAALHDRGGLEQHLRPLVDGHPAARPRSP